MLGVLSATVPIFLVVGLGYACTRAGMFTRADMSAFSKFVAKIALPLLVFINVSGRSAGEIFQPVYLLTYTLAALAMFVLASLWCSLRGRPPARRAFMGMAMGGTNNGFMGFAIFLIVVPDAAGAAVGMDMLVDNIVIIPLTLFLAERAYSAGEAGVLTSIVRATKSVVTHPLMIAIAAALMLNASGVEVPVTLGRAITLVAQISSGLALFTVGGMLVGLQIKGMLSDVVFSVVAKLLLMPAVGLGVLLALEAAGLPPLAPEFKAAAIITTALPTFTVLTALGEKYGEGEFGAAAVMTGTVASFATLTGWMLLLTHLGWL
ncbi:MAG: AEC family transporter [Dermatophilus congolensis]|nr:AEC family transporter [Dermatophilus congolensis]